MIQNGRHITYFAAENPPSKPSKLDDEGSIEGFEGFEGGGQAENADSPTAGGTFPTEAFPNEIAEYIRTVSRVAMVPEQLAGATALGVLSAAIGAGVEIESYLGSTRGNLFLMPIAATGTGKDLATNLVAFPLLDLERERGETWQLETEPALQSDLNEIDEKLKKQRSKQPTTPDAEADRREAIHNLSQERAQILRELDKEPELVTGNITREKLSLSLSQQPGEAITSLSAESRGIVDVLDGRYSGNGSGDEDLYCSGFSGTYCKINRMKGKPIHLRRPCLSVLWMLQPDRFAEMLSDAAKVESGLLPRFLFFDTRAQPELIPENMPVMPQKRKEDWQKLILSLVEQYRDKGDEPVHLQVDKEALNTIRTYDNEIRASRRAGGDLHDVNAFASRWPELTWKVALVLHTGRYGIYADRYPVAKKTASDAVSLIRWFSSEALLLLETPRAKRRTEREAHLVSILTTSQDHTSTLRDLRLRNGFTTEEIETIAARSTKIKITKHKPDGGGRPSHLVTLQK